jgi:TonB-dependent starch-binding outer membrane protein SusC
LIVLLYVDYSFIFQKLAFMKKILSFFSILCFCQIIFAQTRQITGKITDAKDSTSIAGATITTKGGKNSVISQKDGTFSIMVDGKDKELTISSLGYANREVNISASSMNIFLTQSSQSLNEVVVVGYGTALKKNLTGSISKVAGSEVENTPTPSFEQAIQGKAPGVVISAGSGKVGNAIQIQIRGVSSISASSQPLYVIDGLPVTSSSITDPISGENLGDATNDATDPMADINPNDIASIEILKDASAAAIYGARAANGVVIITTKKGQAGQKTTFQLDMNKGWSNPERTLTFCNAAQYVSLINIAANDDAQYDFANGISGYSSLQASQAAYQSSYYQYPLDQFALGTDWQHQAVNTNWQALSFEKNAPSSSVNLSAQGGNDKTKFFVSGFYDTQDAIVIDNKFSRYGGRLNLEQNATDKLSFGINLSVDRSEIDKVDADNSFATPGELVAQLPISPEFDPQTGLLNTNTLYSNGLFDALYNFDRQVTFRTLGNVFANYNILPSLTFRSEFGADILNLAENEFAGKETIDGATGNGTATALNSQSVNFNTNNYFTYSPKINDNNKLSAVIGTSYEQDDLKKDFVTGQGFPSDAIKDLAGSTIITTGNSTGARYTFLSYFLRANYTLLDKYLLSASIRTDGSSRFSPGNRYGWFPSGSAGWILSEEKFLKNSHFINFLKVRASYGLEGNAEIGEAKFYSLYGVTNYPDFPGYDPIQLSDPNLKWESTSQTDVGFDFGFLNNRITGTADYYFKHTTNLLLNVNIPATTGYLNVLQNVGSMNNQGEELLLESKNIDDKNFKWTTSFNIAHNTNKVLNIDGQLIENNFGLTQRVMEGEPIGVFFGQKFLGVDPQNGNAEYLGTNGKPTEDYASAARIVLGNSNPTLTGGFTNTFSYKGFDLSVLFTFVSGNDVYNTAGVYMSDGC